MNFARLSCAQLIQVALKMNMDDQGEPGIN